MDVFSYVTATIMLIMGIGITQLLGDVVDAFRSRQIYRLQWIPMTWAAIVFAWQMQFLWAILELEALQADWTAFEFAILLILALLLFIAGSLVVPRASDESPDAYEQFHQDGRWTLLVLSVFFFLAYIVNVFLFRLNWLSPINLEDPVLGLALLIAVFRKKRSTWAVTTILFALASIVAIANLSPRYYD